MRFQESYLRLNERQKQAVDHVYGPALILAGAGTGKTQVLTLRVTRLMQSDVQVAPDNILCLTYTDAGAKAMRARLVQFIGPAAYRTTITTFHSFCSDIIKYNMDYFGFRQLEAIDELEDIRVIYELINKLPDNNPLKRIKGDPYFEVYRMKNLFSYMKEEGWDEASVKAACKRFLDPLVKLIAFSVNTKKDNANNIDTYKQIMIEYAQDNMVEDYVYKKGNKTKNIIAGDIKIDKIDEEGKNCDLLMAAAGQFKAYQQRLKEMNRYDFSDMIHWVIDAFRSYNGEWLLQQYQERYQFVLLDEMQDTSGPQFELLSLLMGYWESPNIFAVGDIDQTLYAFSGARIQNILEYKEKYDPVVITLNENYRSTQSILDSAKNVITNNVIRLTSRIDISDPSALVSHFKGETDQAPPVCIECKNILEEESIIVDKIRQLIENGANPEDIAVLYRKHRQAENIIKMLSSMDIPVNARKRVDILQQPIVKQLINMLRYCADHRNLGEDRMDLLYEILHYPYMENTHIMVNQMIKDRQKSDNPDFIEFENLATKCYTESIPEFIQTVMTDTGMLSWVTRHSQSRELLVYLSTFMDWAKAYCFKNPFAKMLDMLEDIDKMIDRDLQLTCQDIYVGEKGVTFSTVHGAKGLEWSNVFLIGCTSNEWEKARGRNDSYRLPPTISKAEGDDDLEAARRLFYVAITRAKISLTITYSSHNNDGKELEMTRFIAESEIPVSQMTMVGNSQRFYDRLYNLLNKAQPVLTIQDPSYLKELVEGYVLSPSAVNKFLECPLKWYFENLIRVPFVATGALIFGNAFHYAMNKFYDEARNPNGPITFGSVMQWFEDDMKRHRGQISSEEWNRRMSLGNQLIPLYWEKIMLPSNKITLNEYKIRNVILPNGVPFKGDIDKMEFDGNLVDLVDYKTGKYTYVKNELKPPTEDFIGGGIWRQLLLYCILVDRCIHSKPWKTRSARVEMLDSEYMGPIPLERFNGDETIVLNQVKGVWDRIQVLDFLTGCGDDDCKWCQFVKKDI